MNRAIIPAIIVVGTIAIILSSYEWDEMNMNIDGAEPLEPLYIQGHTRDNGEITCPDGTTKDTARIFSSISFAQDMLGEKGGFGINTQDSNPQRGISSRLFNGNITSSDYQVYGVAQISESLANQCGITWPDLTKITVWGLCGEGVTINFETDNGIKGSSVGTVVCV